MMKIHFLRALLGRGSLVLLLPLQTAHGQTLEPPTATELAEVYQRKYDIIGGQYVFTSTIDTVESEEDGLPNHRYLWKEECFAKNGQRASRVTMVDIETGEVTGENINIIAEGLRKTLARSASGASLTGWIAVADDTTTGAETLGHSMLNPPGMRSLLLADDIRIRLSPETIDGHECVVVERGSSDTSSQSWNRWWLAPSLDYAVVKYVGISNGVTVLDISFWDFFEVKPSLYVPASGKCQGNYDFGDGSALRFQRTWSDISFDLDAEIPDTAFAMEFPGGTRVLDERTQTIRKIPLTEFQKKFTLVHDPYSDFVDRSSPPSN
ncbi:MAG: hypothetical protein WD873_06200 [Candidatus Hydrogenedentales bacterium]